MKGKHIMIWGTKELRSHTVLSINLKITYAKNDRIKRVGTEAPGTFRIDWKYNHRLLKNDTNKNLYHIFPYQ